MKDTSVNHEESRVRDYISLLKPRVMSLVVFTGFAGLYLAPGKINPVIAAIAILCIAIGSGAAGAINMWYDKDIDKIMKRTQTRPIPAKRVNPESALEFGVCMSFVSVFLMGVAVNYLSAFILLIAILFYVFIYTIWLKRNTPQNIVIGGAAGSFPPMIGWAAVTNSISLEAIILFSIIFMWTPPHFWALSLYKSDDYKEAGVPMLSVTHGELVTKRHIFVYSVLMVLTASLPYFIKMSSWVYLTASLILGIKFIYDALRLLVSRNIILAPKLFGYSILYLFLIFTFLILDKIFFI
ncbi:MAG: heme o synthase [Sphingobacteriia bacterium]|nr:heme o synthase [Sphingobacteriia bacterium]